MSKKTLSNGGAWSGGDSCKFDTTPVNDAQLVVESLLAQQHVEAWVDDDYQPVGELQLAPANSGRVDLMRSLREGGRFVAVKQMPNEWMTGDHIEFCFLHATSQEKPWLDIGIVRYLHREGYAHICEPLGVYKNHASTFVVSALAEFGDLMSCLGNANLFPRPGPQREAVVWPLVHQVLIAVKQLHELGIGHRDLSPENIVLTQGADGLIVAKLIDFAMASFCRFACGAFGKKEFQAPEMHLCQRYDVHLADVFAAGVVVFVVATGVYPWFATRPGHCHIFACVQANGLRAELARQPVQGNASWMLGDALSLRLLDFLEGLWALDPSMRFTLDQICQDMASDNRNPQAAWLREAPTGYGISPFCLPSNVYKK